MSDHFSPFQGICAVCGAVQEFQSVGSTSIREEYPCAECRCSIRFRDQANIIVDEFGRGIATSLAKLVVSPWMQDVSVYEASLRGPFIRHFMKLPNYVRSYYFDGMEPGEVRDGVRHEDLRALTFDDQSFDLVVTSDVFEHVFDPMAAFAEIRRVLRPGGLHVFTIPTKWPIDDTSVERARLEGGRILNLTPERYHTAGDGSPSLVVTDFGADLIDRLNRIGLRTTAIRRSMPMTPGHRVLTFVSRRFS